MKARVVAVSVLCITLLLSWIGAGKTTLRRPLALSTGAMTVADDQGPTIEWYDIPENSSTVIGIMWDGVYTGQTVEVRRHIVQVSDSDGVDTVILMFRWPSYDTWTNVTGVLVSGNSKSGSYAANFTYLVWWNETSSSPAWEGDGGYYYYKVWANDTLGNWSTVPEVYYMGGYAAVFPPTNAGNDTSSPQHLEGLIVAAGALAAVTVLVVVVLVRRAPAQRL